MLQLLGYLAFHQSENRMDCEIFSLNDTTQPPVNPTTDSSTNFCTFGTDYPKYNLNERFKSGCGDCICDNGMIRCSEGECPELVCDSTTEMAIFCEEDSLCLYHERVSSNGLGPVSENRRGCLQERDWPYATSMSDNITVFDPSALSGEVSVCSENWCNAIGYSTGFQPCELNGVNYNHMEEFRPDECNLCACVNGTISCTSEPCNGQVCSEYAIDYLSAFVDPQVRNVTCRFDETCAYAENVSFAGFDIVGEASGCVKRADAPEPGQCTNDIFTVGLLFPISFPFSGTLCTVNNSVTLLTSTISLETTNVGTTTQTPRATITTQTPRTTPKAETSFSPSASPTFCSLDSEVGTTITKGSCECTCKIGTDKQPQESCQCVFLVKMVFKDDFSSVASDINGFEREIISALSEVLKIPRKSISNIQISEGSIVVDAQITSESESTQDELKQVVNDGSFKVTFNGNEFTADRVEITEVPPEDQPKPSQGHTVVFVLAGFFFGLALFAVIFTACFVFHKSKRTPARFESMRNNDNHGYDVPPVEYEPHEKDYDGKEILEHGAVSNQYHRSLALQLSEPLPSDTEKAKDQAESNDYQRSIDAENVSKDEDDSSSYQQSIDAPNDGLSFINEAFTTD